jgi:UDP-N-acetylmuramoyl-L-alanyl-D-glutamate--2,6-diaminopimelate ligase
LRLSPCGCDDYKNQRCTRYLEGIKNKSVITVILDRPSAINETISKCSVNDIILIAGKGSESYQIVGTEKFPMCDKTMAIEAIQRHFNTEKTI